MKIFLVLACGLVSFSIYAGDITFPGTCEEYESHDEPISLQHRYVKRLDKFSCRMMYRVRQNLIFWDRETGKWALEYAKGYRQAIKDLHKCTAFTYENTNQDRVYACSKLMTNAYAWLFKLSDLLAFRKDRTLKDCWYVLVHNRRGLDIIIGQTDFVPPKRSWHDYGQGVE